MKNLLKHILASLFVILLIILTTSFAKPKKDKVPDAKTAIKIAESAWIPVFGEETVIEQRPFAAKIEQDSIWHVVGNISQDNDIVEYDNQGRITKAIILLGGKLHAFINKRNGTVINIYHTR